MTAKRFSSFSEFYPYYLSEHANPTCRLLHFIGSILVLALIVYSLVTARYVLLWGIPLIGYGFAWVGHFFMKTTNQQRFLTPYIA
jgi:hypothetical protein